MYVNKHIVLVNLNTYKVFIEKISSFVVDDTVFF